MPKDTVFMEVGEVARLLGLTGERVRQLAKAGALPHVRRGRRFLFPRGAWSRWVAEQNNRALATAQIERVAVK